MGFIIDCSSKVSHNIQVSKLKIMLVERVKIQSKGVISIFGYQNLEKEALFGSFVIKYYENVYSITYSWIFIFNFVYLYIFSFINSVFTILSS